MIRNFLLVITQFYQRGLPHYLRLHTAPLREFGIVNAAVVNLEPTIRNRLSRFKITGHYFSKNTPHGILELKQSSSTEVQLHNGNWTMVIMQRLRINVLLFTSAFKGN